VSDIEITLATSPRGEGRELRIRLTTWQGRAGLDVREWYFEGEWKPGKGIRLRANELAQLGSAVDAALARIDRGGRIVEPVRESDPTEAW
jgi:hypothetical protein